MNIKHQKLSRCVVVADNTRDAGLIPGSGRSPGVGSGNPLQYSCLENSLDREAWWATVHGIAKNPTRLSMSHQSIRMLPSTWYILNTCYLLLLLLIQSAPRNHEVQSEGLAEGNQLVSGRSNTQTHVSFLQTQESQPRHPSLALFVNSSLKHKGVLGASTGLPWWLRQ